MENNTALPSTGFIRLAKVLQFIPISRSAWYQGIQEGRFPRPVLLGPRAAAYRAEDIRDLIAKISNGEVEA